MIIPKRTQPKVRSRGTPYTSFVRVITYAESESHNDNCDKSIRDGDRAGGKERASDNLEGPEYLRNINYKQKVLNL